MRGNILRIDPRQIVPICFPSTVRLKTKIE
jgi:hypothetical protein